MRGADDIDDVIKAQQGDDHAFSALFDRWFDRVHDVAFHIVRDPSVSAEVTQDVFLNAWQKLDTLQEPAAFGGWLLRSSRNRALNRLQYERRSTPIGTEETTVEIDRRRPGIDATEVHIDADWQQQLVWAASAALGERDASILSLHLRFGLDAPELAEELGVTPNNAHQLLFRLREHLGDAIASWTVWSDGSPRCEALKDLVDRAGLSTFDRATAKAVKQHTSWCDECGEERKRGVAPQAIFAGVPILIAPAALKTKVATALELEGVPVSSTSAGASGDPSSDPLPSAVGSSAPAVGAGSQHRLRRVTFMAVGAAALILAVIFLATQQASDGQADDIAANLDPTTSTTTPSTTATSAPVAPPPPPPPSPPPPPADSTTSSTEDPGPAPTIDVFRVFRRPATGCATPSEVVRLAWSTTDATEVTITGPGAPQAPQAPTGSLDLCVAGPGNVPAPCDRPGRHDAV